jgi:SNF2 family DNA or RNA helicase
MDRTQASQLCRAELNKHGLNDWKVRVSSDPNQPFLGLCMHREKVIMINGYHVDLHGDAETRCTILHEIAHAIVGPSHRHNAVWAAKASEIGCDNTEACSTLDLPPHIIDAIRSGHTVEVVVDEKKVEQIIRTVTHKVTRLQDMCPDCGKVAKEKFAIDTFDKDGNQVKLITLECFHIIKKVIPRGTAFDTMVSNGWKPEIKSCFHKWAKNQCELCGEYKLFNFQIIGARFAESALSMQKGAGIFDDMGLGKTVQALAIIKFHSDKYTPTMYITKSAITFQWFKQIIRWLGPDFLPQIISTSRDFLYPGLKSYIIPYDLLRRFPREKLYKLGIKCVVLDECQQIKNPDSARTQEVRKLISSNGECKVIPLSGTPWKNRGDEFFPVLNMMDPIKFHSYQAYLDRWVEFYYEGNKKKMGGIRNPLKFREYTESLLIRREYNEVMDEFPDINRMKLNVQLDKLSQDTYDDSVGEFVKWYNEFVIGGEEDKVSGIEILAQMARMRHITGLAKIPATLGFVEEFVEDTDKKLVIFVHHKDVGQLMYSAMIDESEANTQVELAKQLRIERVKVFRYTSDLNDGERFTMQEAFNNTPRAVMVASTQACGEGVDLQTCADSILHERQWNPQNEDQATPGRFRRIGQKTKVINITVPEAEGTIDEHLDALVEEKRRQFHEVMNKGIMPTWSESDFARKLAEVIVAKHQEKIKAKGGKQTAITVAATLVKR